MEIVAFIAGTVMGGLMGFLAWLWHMQNSHWLP